ncbi:ketopantoate reductase family protein [Halomonas cerina]|nr:2-dehydropantoate 2-reductase [Halomonas cerina]
MTDPIPLIIGPGALGRLLAVRLATRGETWLAGRRRLPATQTLTTPEGQTLVRCLPTTTLDALPTHTPLVVHLTTKAMAVEAVVASLRQRLPAGTPLVLWQNGFGVQRLVSDHWPGPVLCATTTEGAYVEDDRHVVHAGHGQTALGSLDGRHQDLARRLAGRLTAAGLPTESVPDIRLRLWRKLAVNAAINPLVARFRIRNGQLRDRPFRPMVDAVIDEVAVILDAEGVTPPEGVGVSGWQALVWRVVEGTAGNRASMLQDVLAGRPTEHEAILGPLRAAARHHGLPTPTLDALYRELDGVK